jgi:hypothetical protein
MGYFDFLTSSYFKAGRDGRKQFFPWGILGDGYTIASEQDYLRLQQQIKIYMIVSLVPVIGAASLKGDLVGLLQRLPVDLNQDGFRGSGEALWH